MDEKEKSNELNRTSITCVVQVDASSHSFSSLLFIIVISMQNYSQFFSKKKLLYAFGDETSLHNSVLMMLNEFVYN